MARYINLADSKGRNAEVIFSGITKKSAVRMVTADGNDVKTLRVLKGKAENAYEGLILKYGDQETVAQKIIQEDPEIDVFMTGRFITGSSKVYVDKNLRPVFKISTKEVVYAPDGTVKEERIPKETVANIIAEFPVRPTGKLFPRKEIYSKLVFAKKYQVRHVNGLTFDFLYELAKELNEKDSLMMLAAGPKGNEPLVFQDGGKGYRAFLEGRLKADGYILLLHLSNLELKAVQ